MQYCTKNNNFAVQAIIYTKEKPIIIDLLFWLLFIKNLLFIPKKTNYN